MPNREKSHPRDAPFTKNQGPRAFATFSKNPTYTSFFLGKTKQYIMYNFNDNNTSDNMYT